MPPVRTTCTLTHQFPHMPHVATCTHTHTHGALRPTSGTPSTLLPSYPARALQTPGPQQLGEKIWFFFFSITVATLLPILCLVHNGQELLRKSILAPFQAPEGMGPEIVLFQLWEGRPTMACLGSGTIASRSLAAWGQMSTQHLLRMPTKSHCPLNQALFCHWNILPLFLCLLKSSPFLDALHKLHLSWRGQLEMISLISALQGFIFYGTHCSQTTHCHWTFGVFSACEYRDFVL